MEVIEDQHRRRKAAALPQQPHEHVAGARADDLGVEAPESLTASVEAQQCDEERNHRLCFLRQPEHVEAAPDLPGDLQHVLALAEEERRADDLDERKERGHSAEGRAVPLQHQDAFIVQASAQLVQEPRLPDPGLADHVHHPQRSPPYLLPRALEPRQLALATDELREAASEPESGLLAAAETINGLGRAREVDRTQLEPPLQEGPGRVADEDGVGVGPGHQRLEDRPGLPLRVGVDLRRAADAADHRGHHVDSHPHADRGTSGWLPLVALHDRERSLGRAPGGVFARLDAERGHDARLAELLDASVEHPDLLHQRRQGASRIRGRRQVRRRSQVRAEEHDVAPVPADAFGRRRRDGARRHVGRGLLAGGRGGDGRRDPVVGSFVEHRLLEPARCARRPAGGRRGRERNPPPGVQPVLLHPIAERVAREPEPSGGAGHVPARLLERLDELPPLIQLLGLRPRARVRRERRAARAFAETKARRAHDRRLRQQRHPRHHVSELADVAGPSIAEQRLAGVVGQRAGGPAVVGAGTGQEVLGQPQDVPGPLAQRRQPDGQHRQPVVQLFAETPGPHRRLEVVVGRGQDPDVDRFEPRAPEAAHRAVFEDLEQLRLKRFGQQPDLVEEDRPAMRGLEQPGLRLPRVGEGAPLESEQLGLEQGLGDGRAIHVDERPAGAGTGAVDRPGQQSLARARLAADEDRRKTAALARELQEVRDLLPHRDDSGALPDQLGQWLRHCNRSSCSR